MSVTHEEVAPVDVLDDDTSTLDGDAPETRPAAMAIDEDKWDELALLEVRKRAATRVSFAIAASAGPSLRPQCSKSLLAFSQTNLYT